LGKVKIWFHPNYINNLKVESGQPKGNVIQTIGTSGLPKVKNDYGNRGIIVPTRSHVWPLLKDRTRGRIPGFNLRAYSTSAGSPVLIESNTNIKLLKLAKHCETNKGTVKMDKVYRLMYDV
jgi:hypothetical protein